MKRFLSLVMAMALTVGLIAVPGAEANAAKRYAVAAYRHPADHYVTISADKPVKGSTITAEKMEITGDILQFVNENGGLGKVGYFVYECYEYIYENGEYVDQDGKRFFYSLSGKDSITHTVTKDCIYVYGAWGIKDDMDEYPMEFSNTVIWDDDGKVWGGLPDTGDYDIELSPVSDAPTTAPTPETVITPSPTPAPATGTFKEEAANTVYRLLNKSNNAHLYTTDVNEARTLTSQGWEQEISSGISATSGTGVYRLYNRTSGEHLYTSDTNEVNVLAGQGWQKDFDGKPLFYGAANGSKAVYRLFNASAPQVASHHYTSDQNEINILRGQGWQFDNEGKPVYTLQ